MLLDMSLPKMDGFTVLRKLKESATSRRIPVVALTARAMKGDRERTLEAGCDDYISKPIDREEMLEKIGHWVSTTTSFRTGPYDITGAKGRT